MANFGLGQELVTGFALNPVKYHNMPIKVNTISAMQHRWNFIQDTPTISPDIHLKTEPTWNNKSWIIWNCFRLVFLFQRIHNKVNRNISPSFVCKSTFRVPHEEKKARTWSVREDYESFIEYYTSIQIIIIVISIYHTSEQCFWRLPIG